MRFNHHKYTWSKPYSAVRHNWELVGPDGGIHFHACITDKYDPSCGLEIHYSRAARPGHLKNDAPGQTNCHLIGEPCWHDGTSLYASEALWPVISAYVKTGDHEKIFRILEREYDERFGKSEESSEAA